MLNPMSEEEKRAIESLQQKGYVVIYWDNTEVEKIRKDRLEQEVVAFGQETINFMELL